MRGTELRLGIIVQNQASSSIGRIKRDIASLSRTVDLANRSQAISIRQDQVQARIARTNRDLTQLKSQAAYTAAMAAAQTKRVAASERVNTSLRKQQTLSRQLFDLDTRRLKAQLNHANLLSQKRGAVSDIAARRGALGAMPGFNASPGVGYAAPGAMRDAWMKADAALRIEEAKLAEMTKKLDTQLNLSKRDMKSLAMQANLLKDSAASLVREHARLNTALQQTRMEYERLRTAERTDSIAIAEKEAQLKALELQYKMTGEAAAKAALAERQKPFLRAAALGRTTTHIGRAAMLAGGVGTLALGAAATKAASFDTQSTLAATQVQGIGNLGNTNATGILATSKKLQEDTLKLMMKYPATAEDIAKSNYDIYSSMDVTYNQGQKLEDMFNRVAIAGGVDLPTATDAGITALNNFAGASGNLNNTINTMFATVRFGRITFDQFNQMLGQVAPAAKGAGLSLLDVSGAMATLTRLMPKSQQAATGIARLIQALNNPDVDKGLEDQGIQVHKLTGEMRPLYDIMADITKQFPNLKKGIGDQNFFRIISALGRGEGNRGNTQTIQAVRAFTLLATSMELFHNNQEKITKDTGEFNRSYIAMSQTMGVRWETFKTQMQATAIIVGQQVIPVFLRIAGVISDIAQWFDNLDPKTKKMIGQFAAWAAVITLIAGALAIPIGLIISLAGSIGVLMTALGGVGGGGAIGALATMLGLLTSIAALGVISVVVAVKFHDSKPAELARDWWDKHFGGLTDVANTVDQKLGGHGFVPFSNFGNEDDRHRAAISGKTFGITPLKKKKRTAIDELLDIATNPDTAGNINKAKKAYEAFLKQYQANLPGGAKDPVTKARDAAEAASQRATEIAAQRADAITAATSVQVDTIRGKIQELESTFNQMRDNEASTMGGLFSGDTGDFAVDKLMEVYQRLAQFNIAPPAALLKRQQEAQLKSYEKLQADFAKIRKRGASSEFVDQLKQMGPQGRLIASSLANADPGTFKRIQSNFNKGQKQITDAATLDFKGALSHWNTYGKNAAHAVVRGILSQSGKLRAAFENFVLPDLESGMNEWIKKTFPNLINRAAKEAARKFDADQTNQAKAAKVAAAAKKAKGDEAAAKAAAKTRKPAGATDPVVVHDNSTKIYPQGNGKEVFDAFQRHAFSKRYGGH